MTGATDPEEYVEENRETLVRILKHGDDEFVRALALSALIRYGDAPTLSDVEHEIEQAKQEMQAGA